MGTTHMGPADALHTPSITIPLARSRGTGALRAELRRLLSSEDWLVEPTAWTEAVTVLRGHEKERELCNRLLVDAVSVCVKERFTSGRADAALGLVRALVGGAERQVELAERVASWFLAGATAGDAGVAWSLLFTLLFAPTIPAPSTLIGPLGRWVVERGSAVLRTRDAALQLRVLTERAWTFDRDLAIDLLSYGLREGTFQTWWPFGMPDRRQGFWPIIEAAISRGEAEEHALDVLRLGPPELFDPILRKEGACPRCRDAVVRGLLADAIPLDKAEVCWRALLADATMPPADIAFSSKTALDAALRASIGTSLDPRWARLLARDAVRVLGTEAGRDPVGVTLLAMAHRHSGVLGGLREALPDAPSALAPALTIAGTDDLLPDRERARAVATVEFMRRLRPELPAASHFDLIDVGVNLTRLLNGRPWPSVSGTNLWRHVERYERVAVRAEVRDDKVWSEERTLVLNVNEIAPRVLRMSSAERRERTILLYFIHELMHVQQGMGSKSVVEKVRAAGAEHTLLNLDLAADHVAVVLASKLDPRFEIPGSLELLGGPGFPASPRHTAAARARKALRSVSLSFEALLRGGARSDLKVDEGEYLFADHGPVGGTLVLYAIGHVVRVCAFTTLQRDEAVMLCGVADEMGRRPAPSVVRSLLMDLLSRVELATQGFPSRGCDS